MPEERRRIPRLPRLLFLVAFLVLLAGCTNFVDHDQISMAARPAAIVAQGHPVGQTFVTQHAGLDGVDLWLAPDRPGNGRLRLVLRAGPQASVDIATAGLPLCQLTGPAFYHFDFPALPGSFQQRYYAPQPFCRRSRQQGCRLFQPVGCKQGEEKCQ